MSIPPSFLQDLLARTDIVEVVGRHVQLKKGGANFMGLCPFHGEKSPSFSVSPSKQFYHCFGCGVNGNAISFLMAHNGMGFVEAVKELAQQIGVNIPDDPQAPEDREYARRVREQQSSLTDVLALAAKAYQKQLKVSARAVNYLKGRGLTGEVALRFGLGYAPSGWRPLASLVPDYADSRLVDSGLVIQKDPEAGHQEERRYDRFRDRIMFPIRNVKGDVIGFGGRVLDHGEPKYLNSPETPVFSKGNELYGLYEARADIRNHGMALVTEGYMDVVALAQHGFGHAVATLGTACTAEHVQKLFRFTESVVFSFDGDSAGRRAATKAMVAALPHATDTRSIRFLFLPPEHDPDSFIRDQGTDAFGECVRTALPLSRYLIQVASEGCELQTPEGRARMAAQSRPLWSALPDGALKRQLLTELAQLAQLDPTDLFDLWQPTNRSTTTAPTPAFSGRAGTDGLRPTRDAASIAPPSDRWPPRRKASAGSWRPPRQPQVHHTRAAQVTRILLAYPTAWSRLSPEDLDLLTRAPAPHGPLLRWLEHQWQEHGSQPWAVLQQAMAGESFAQEAERAMAQANLLDRPNSTQAEADAQAELRDALTRMHIDHLGELTRAAADEAGRNPHALTQLKEWQERRANLLRELQTTGARTSTGDGHIAS